MKQTAGTVIEARLETELVKQFFDRAFKEAEKFEVEITFGFPGRTRTVLKPEHIHFHHPDKN